MEQFEELDIKRLLRIMSQSLNFIIVTTLLVGIVAFVYNETMVLPSYQSSVTMYVNNNNRSTLLSKTQTSGADMQASQMLVETYIEIIKSDNLFVSSSVTSTMLLYIIQNKIFLSSFRNYQNFVLEITIILFLLMLLQVGLILMFYFSKKRQLELRQGTVL